MPVYARETFVEQFRRHNPLSPLAGRGTGAQRQGEGRHSPHKRVLLWPDGALHMADWVCYYGGDGC